LGWVWLYGLALAGAHEGHGVGPDALHGALERYVHQLDDAPYYVAVALTKDEYSTLRVRDGSPDSPEMQQRAYLDVDLRVGTPERDSTHPLRGISSYSSGDREVLPVAYDGPGQAKAIEMALWSELERATRIGRERLVMLEANACGTPVAAYPVTGPVDIVQPGINGVLDHHLLHAVQKARKLDRQQCRNVAEQHDWSRVAKQLASHLAPIDWSQLHRHPHHRASLRQS